MYWVWDFLISLVIVVLVFSLLVFAFKFVYNKLKSNSNRFFDLKEYLPEEEIHSLRQIFFLIMMLLCFILFIYAVSFTQSDLFVFAVIEIIMSIYLASKLDLSSLKNKIIFLFLIPFNALGIYVLKLHSPDVLSDFLIIFSILDLLHSLVFIYFIKVYYDKFRQYTVNNSLGMSVLLLFLIIAISFFLTIFTEDVSPIDSINMVSNAFTSNGYAILGHSTLGKLNDILLVWGGYVLSGVGTATLTAAILSRSFNKRFDELEKLIEKNKKD